MCTVKALYEAKIASNREISKDVFELVLFAPELSQSAEAGQFLNLFADNGKNLLPRPISICSRAEDSLTLVYRALGEGTRHFSKLGTGKRIRATGPLGHGFSKPEGKSVLIGGGMGVFPLLFLAETLPGQKTAVLGFQSSPVYLEKFRDAGCEVFISTDDGSLGFKGNAVELLKRISPDADNYFACGPQVMLKKTAEYLLESGKDCELLMEERMACGIGVCMGCAIKIKKGENDWEYKKVCKDGPAFKASEVIFE